MKSLFNLQLFAASDYTNATTDVGLSPEMKTFYDTVLLKNALPNLVFQQFGLKQPLPQGNGKVVEWRKFGGLNKATTPLTEGVTPDGHKVSVSYVKADLYQYGDFTMVSDVLDLIMHQQKSKKQPQDHRLKLKLQHLQLNQCQ